MHKYKKLGRGYFTQDQQRVQYEIDSWNLPIAIKNRENITMIDVRLKPLMMCSSSNRSSRCSYMSVAPDDYFFRFALECFNSFVHSGNICLAVSKSQLSLMYFAISANNIFFISSFISGKSFNAVLIS